jgi:polyisoprenoid-binding protein YceI
MNFAKNLKALLMMIIICLSPATTFAADKYEFDKAHTNILFYVNHLGFSDMVGRFTDYDGSFTFDEKNPEDSTAEIKLKPAGIRTSSEQLDSKLQGEDFFKSDQFPEIKFVSNKIKVTGSNSGELHGSLTMLGVTKPLVLTVHFNKAGYHPINGRYVAGFTASATVKRSEFGMKSYLPMVGDEVRIEVQAEGVNLDRKKMEEIKHK